MWRPFLLCSCVVYLPYATFVDEAGAPLTAYA